MLRVLRRKKWTKPQHFFSPKKKERKKRITHISNGNIFIITRTIIVIILKRKTSRNAVGKRVAHNNFNNSQQKKNLTRKRKTRAEKPSKNFCNCEAVLWKKNKKLPESQPPSNDFDSGVRKTRLQLRPEVVDAQNQQLVFGGAVLLFVRGVDRSLIAPQLRGVEHLKGQQPVHARSGLPPGGDPGQLLEVLVVPDGRHAAEVDVGSLAKDGSTVRASLSGSVMILMCYGNMLFQIIIIIIIYRIITIASHQIDIPSLSPLKLLRRAVTLSEPEWLVSGRTWSLVRFGSFWMAEETDQSNT